MSIGFIGAGNHATGVLIPAFLAAKARLKTVASAQGVTATYAARKFGAEFSASDAEAIFADPGVDAVVIATRHASHAQWVCRSLGAGKDVFVEKPLALTISEIDAVETAYREALRGRPAKLMVGFNRRFSVHVRRMRTLLAAVGGPLSMAMTVNAGSLPLSHWTQDPEEGGRIAGEACHFIDLMRHLADSPIETWQVAVMRAADQVARIPDTVTISLSFRNGSIGTIHYFSNGHRAWPKERLEVFCQGRILQLDNFVRLSGSGWPGFRSTRSWRQDKGQRACAAAFVECLEMQQPSPIPFDELMEVSRVTVAISEAIQGR